MPSAPVLSVDGLSRSYGAFEALSGVELELEPGDCVAVLGRNGSGKTTLVRLIAGLLEPTAGVVQVLGVDVHREPESLEARAATATVLDSPSLYGDLTVGEHLELVAVAHGAAGGGLDGRIDGVLGGLGLGGRRGARPGELSRGMRQKLALACALIRPHRLLVLDEPVVGLDPESQLLLRELLLDARRKGVAVLFTTHQLQFARGVAERALVLSDGEVIASGPYEEIIQETSIGQAGLS